MPSGQRRPAAAQRRAAGTRCGEQRGGAAEPAGRLAPAPRGCPPARPVRRRARRGAPRELARPRLLPGRPQRRRRVAAPRRRPSRSSEVASYRPSPVITRSAPASAPAAARRSRPRSPRLPAAAARPRRPRARTRSRPPRRRRAAAGSPPSKPASRARPASSTATSAGVAPFCGPNTAAAPPGPSSGARTSVRQLDPAGRRRPQSGQVDRGEPAERRRRRAAAPARPSSRNRAPSAASAPVPPSVHAEPPRATTISLRAGVQCVRDQLTDAVAVRVERLSSAEQGQPGRGRELDDGHVPWQLPARRQTPAPSPGR